MGATAGWYDDGSGRQRWFDGTQWTDHFLDAPVPPTPDQPQETPGHLPVENLVTDGATAPSATTSVPPIAVSVSPTAVAGAPFVSSPQYEAPPVFGVSVPPVNPYAPAPSAAPIAGKRPMGLAVAALIVGIVAFFSGLLPIWGILAGLAGVALGIVALVRGQSKPLSIIGAVLGGFALLASFGTTFALIAGVPSVNQITSSPQSSAAPSGSPVAAAPPSVTPTPTAIPTPTVAPAPEAPAETLAQSNARRSAQEYLDFTSFSRSGLIGQLEFEGFSTEDATYGVDSLNANWNDQAAKKAQEYLDFASFSRAELVDQLIFEGFTAEQAEFGVVAVGY